MKSGVNFFQVGMRLDERAKTRNCGIPRTVKVVRQNVEKVDARLERFRIEVLQILVLGWHYHAEPSCTQCFAQLFHQGDLVLLVNSWIAASSLSAGPLPVDVNTGKVPLIEEFEQRSNEGVSVGLAACHFGPGVASGACIGELPSTCICQPDETERH